jgi:hypothetical protein
VKFLFLPMRQLKLFMPHVRALLVAALGSIMFEASARAEDQPKASPAPQSSPAPIVSPSPAPSPNPTSVPILGGTERSQLKPVNASERWFDGVSLGFGTSYEKLTNRTQQRYRSPNLGIVATYTELIRGPWSGGVGFWLGGWNTRNSAKEYFSSLNPPFDRVTPLRVMTHVEFSPLRQWLATSATANPFLQYLNPKVFFGLGFLAFLQSRAWPPNRADQLNSEVAVRYGLSLHSAWPRTIGTNISWERWRGVKTFDYSGEALTLTIEFGDIGSR